jgi:hypothetical protein
MNEMSTKAPETRPLKSIVIRDDLYPRLKVDPAKVTEYAQNVEQLPPVEINQDDILIDGMHRLRAHETAGNEQVPVRITKTRSDADLFFLAIARNARHGLILSQQDKKTLAVRFCFEGRDRDEAIAALCISRRTWDLWTSDTRAKLVEQRRDAILDMHLRCHSQDEIAKSLDVDQSVVSDEIEEIMESGNFADNHIFRDYEGEESDEAGRRVYDIWSFGKANNEVRHFGNVPPEIVENLVHLYTKPFDVVFDPFGGGGSTFDVCMKRKRRCWISDLTVIPARKDDIREHDISTGLGLPKGLVPDLVFLDPPYWRQAEKKYSDKSTDLANIDLDGFVSVIGRLARDVKTKWRNAKRTNGRLALIISPWKEDGKKVHLQALLYEQISKYLTLEEWISVPYSTQVHGGAFVKAAKDQKQLLYLNRHLMVFRHEG